MKRSDQILQVLVLTEQIDGMSASAIADALGTAHANISPVLAELVSSKRAIVTDTRPALYNITDAGRAHMESPEFGAEKGSSVPPRTPAPSVPQPPSPKLSIGVFTSGELHIEANGKKLVLTKAQASEMIEFICALPNKLFSSETFAKPKTSPFASLIHRIDDKEPSHEQ